MKKVETKIARNKKVIFITALSLIIILAGLGLVKINDWRIKTAQEYNKAGEKAYTEKNWTLALSNYKKSLALDPLNQGIVIKIGNLYFASGNTEKALDYYRKIRGSYQTLNRIGDIYYEKGDFEQANNNYQKSTKVSSNSYAYIGAGKCYLKIGEIDKAQDSFSKSLQVEASSYDARFYLAMVLAYKDSKEADKESKLLNKKDQLETDLKKAISNISSGDLLYGKTILANLFNNLRFPKSAILVLEPELKENSTYRDAFLVLANIHLQLKEYDKAIRVANKAVELDSIYIPSYELLSQIYKEKGDSKKSQEYLDKIASLEIKN